MSKILILFFPILLVSVCYAQQNIFFENSELKNFLNQGGRITEIKDGVYKFGYPSGYTRVFNFNEKKSHNVIYQFIDSIIINVAELDTSKYANKFKYWKQANITNSEYYPLFVDDLNQNGFPELYGYSGRRPNFGFAGPVKVLELNSSGTFDSLFSYENTILVKALGDVHGTSKKEIYFHTVPEYTQSGSIFTSQDMNSIPNIFDFIFYYDVPGIGFQINDMSFGDFNNNGITNCAFVSWDLIGRVIIAEYDSSINNFQTKFNYDTSGINVTGFAIGDFDVDGKDEIIFNYDESGFFVVEASDGNNYQIVHRGELPLKYPWLHNVTNDIDGNGKKEFWIGSVDYLYWTGTTLIAFEAGGDNEYKPVFKVYLQNLATLFGAMYLQSSDLDNDGKEELIISVGNEIVILKFTGSINNHNYEVFYYKNGESSLPQNKLYPCSFYDMNNDDIKDLILPMSNYTTYILTQNDPSLGIILEEPTYSSFQIFQNYPNPFNPITTIEYNLPKRAKVKLTVYDVLGNEISHLVNEEQKQGNYKIEFNGNELSSGVYFYHLQAGEFLETKKMVLIK